MKVCFKCGIEKPLTDYYKHKQMGDGHLNKCKDCTKKDTKTQTEINTSTPEGLEKERARHRDKYRRLNYKEKQKEWDKDKPWKQTSTYKGLSKKFKTPVGYELHHWNYNTEFLEDVVLMPIKEHRTLHRFLKLDLESRILITNNNIPLTNKSRHLSFILSNGLTFLEY